MHRTYIILFVFIEDTKRNENLIDAVLLFFLKTTDDGSALTYYIKYGYSLLQLFCLGNALLGI